jgi:Glycosyl hydrolase family 79 C-terminal beta domain
MRRAHIGAIVVTATMLLAGTPDTQAATSGTQAAAPGTRSAPATTAVRRPGPVVVRPGPDVVNVAAGAPSRPLPRSFLGVSLEYNTVTAYEGTSAKGSNPVLAQLIRNLAPGQTPLLRIAGDSTDWTWWPIRGVRRPPGASNSLTPTWLLRAHTLAQATRAHLILGINLEANSTRIASVEANQLVSGIGSRSIGALEVGNEPQLYPILPWYKTNTGQWRFGRPINYNLGDYASEFASYAAALPKLPLAGPAIGHSWLSQLVGFIRTATSRLRIVTFHSYAINSTGAAFRGRNCSTATSDPAHPSPATLLAPFASEGLMRQAAPAIALAHSRHMAFRVDEMNAVTCAGTPGVSDTFASALWVLNALFAMDRAGVDGVNVHSWRGSAGKLFGFSLDHGTWSASVRPEYYGLMMFARAAPAGSTLEPVTQSNGSNVEAWATMAGDHRVRVMLINHSLTAAQSVVVRVPMARGNALLDRLRAPSVKSTAGMTLAGQSFGAATTTGQLAGPLREVTLKRRGGAYSVRLPAATATLLTAPSAKS